MVAMKFNGTIVIVLFLVLQFSGKIQCANLLSTVLDVVFDLLESVTPILQTSATQDLIDLKTDQFILHYGYIPERHQVITEDGYNLTLFRCNSRIPFVGKKKVVALTFGLVCSSDDFVMNLPHQSLAFVMADAGYDVWLINQRGNYYSRKNLYMDPDTSSAFWNFSYEDIGLKDYPAAFDYIQDITEQPKIFAIGHSMSTSALFALLAVKPEYNDRFHAMSMMAPVGFLEYCKGFRKPFSFAPNREYYPRRNLNIILGTLCQSIGAVICNSLLNGLFGASEGQRNNSMLPTYIGHTPAGTSTTGLYHYIDQRKYQYFGSRNQVTLPRKNYPLHQITVPMSFHHTYYDTYSNPLDVNKLKLYLNNTQIQDQLIPSTIKFDHLDFAWAITASKLVYVDIIKFFAQFE